MEEQSGGQSKAGGHFVGERKCDSEQQLPRRRGPMTLGGKVISYKSL